MNMSAIGLVVYFGHKHFFPNSLQNSEFVVSHETIGTQIRKDTWNLMWTTFLNNEFNGNFFTEILILMIHDVKDT